MPYVPTSIPLSSLCHPIHPYLPSFPTRRSSDLTFTVPGVFVQDEVDIARWLSVSASGRLDHHSEYGTFFSPRVSALDRKSTRLNSSHLVISYAVFCLKKKKP